MATTLTFEAGRRLGVARRQSWSRKPAAGMNHAQRDALTDLVHGPGGPHSRGFDSRPASRRNSGVDYVRMVTNRPLSAALGEYLVRRLQVGAR